MHQFVEQLGSLYEYFAAGHATEAEVAAPSTGETVRIALDLESSAAEYHGA